MTGAWMTSRWAALLGSLTGIAILVVAVKQLPPLTEGGLGQTTVPAYNRVPAPVDEAAYCRDNLQDVDCACFGRKAGHVMDARHPNLPGALYVDRWDLARGQAGTAC